MEEITSHADSPAGRANRLSAGLRCRVLVCSGTLDGGGSERQIWQLVSHLDRQRFAPEIYLLKRSGPYLDALPSDVPVHAFQDAHPHPSRGHG